MRAAQSLEKYFLELTNNVAQTFCNIVSMRRETLYVAHGVYDLGREYHPGAVCTLTCRPTGHCGFPSCIFVLEHRAYRHALHDLEEYNA